MLGRRGDRDAALITDAQRSLAEEQRSRKRVYTALMLVHIGGFALAGLLADVWWLALTVLVVTGPLQWVAVVLANSRGPRRDERRRFERASREGSGGRELAGPERGG